MRLYQLLIRLLSPFIWGFIAWETFRKRAGWAFFSQRLGLHYPAYAQANTAPIWIHCTSVGEVRAAEPLIRALMPQQSLLITTSTPSGQQLVQQLFADRVVHRYLPLDWPYAIRRFLKRNPVAQLWVMETEIWPNLFRIVRQQGLPLKILNGRLSERSLRAPKWLKSTYGQTLTQVDQLLARSRLDAERFIALGAPQQRVEVLGNLKFANLSALPDQPDPIGRPFVVLASSREQEEALVVDTWMKLNRPELLVIVPRHPARRDEILKTLASWRDQTAVHSLGEPIQPATRLYLDDRFGVMMAYFQHAKLVIMGGAFTPKGGHNILEPAAYGKAIITGADMSDFLDEMALLKAHQAIVQLPSNEQLGDALSQLLDDAQKRAQLGEHARQVMVSQTQVLQRYLDKLQLS
jgi:3-deoxy-D-manno-octulosonic-acid transferase